jgi:hypothetical protein
MDPIEMIFLVFVTAAGIVTATVATIACSRRVACAERDRQLIHAYLDRPQEVEVWLIQGAMEHLEQRLSSHIEEKRCVESRHFPGRWSRESSPLALASNRQLA